MRDDIRSFLEERHALDRDVEFGDSESLLEAGVIDSMTIVDLISYLERNYRIRVREEDMVPEHFESVNAIVDYVERRVASTDFSLPMK